MNKLFTQLQSLTAGSIQLTEKLKRDHSDTIKKMACRYIRASIPEAFSYSTKEFNVMDWEMDSPSKLKFTWVCCGREYSTTVPLEMITDEVCLARFEKKSCK